MPKELETVLTSPQLFGDGPAAASAQGLADRKALAIVAFERAKSPLMICNCRTPDNPIVMANPAFLELTGYSPEEVLGRNCRFMQGERTSKHSVDEIRTAIFEERAATVELVNYRKDGSSFLNRLSISPIHDRSGKLLYFFGTQQDISRARKIQELEQSERLLLREVDHRAMNALALVQAIVGLSRSDNVEGYVSSVRGRVQALARAHATLADSGWSGAPLRALIQAEVAPFGDGRADLVGPETTVRPSMVQPMVLIFHEFAANAAAHGAFSVPSGRLNVTWIPDPGTQSVTVHWVEDGGPAPSAVRTPGFGATISKALAERQLQGRLDLDWPATGLRATLSFDHHAR